MATIKDIADKLGVAISTVSKGLNGASDISDEMRQMVLDAAVELGYSSKRARKQFTQKVCIFLEDMDYESIEQFSYDIILGFKSCAANHNFEVTVITGRPDFKKAEKYDTYMLRQGFCGAFLLGFTYESDWMKELYNTHIPTVLLDHTIQNNEYISTVSTDCLEGIDLAVKHLVELGHKKIALLNGSYNRLVAKQRYDAFVSSMHKYELLVDNNLIRYGFFKSICAKEYVSDFIKNGASAIICGNDLIAYGVIKEVERLGLRVPKDISVIGFDDIPLATIITPSLTTVRQERKDLGKCAFQLLDNHLHNIAINKVLLQGKFIARSSTAPFASDNLY